MEHVRMRVFHEPVNTDLTDMELIELKFIFARRESIYYTSKMVSIEFFCQCTTITATTRSSPITNLGTDRRSMNKPFYSGKNLEFVVHYASRDNLLIRGHRPVGLVTHIPEDLHPCLPTSQRPGRYR